MERRLRWPNDQSSCVLFLFFWYEMETGDSDLCLICRYGLKICGGCRGFQDLLAWVIDLGHGFLWVGFSVGGN